MDYLQQLYQWFNNFWDSITNWVQDIFYWIVNTAIKIIGEGISWAASLFPEYTLPSPSLGDSGFLSTLNWVFPVSYAMTLLAVLGTGIVFYLTVGTVLRWFKVVR